MKITKKLPESSSRKHEELLNDGWMLLKEPKTLPAAMFFSIPFMFITSILTFVLISLFSPFSFEDFGFQPEGLVFTISFDFFLYLILLIIIHEFFHLIWVPRFLRSERTYIGITFFGGFVYTEEVINRNRYLFITAAPYVIISVILPVLLGLFGLINAQIKILLLIHSLASSVDALGFMLASRQVPGSGQLVSNGMRTYWRRRDVIEK